MSSFRPPFYKHREGEFKPPGCQCNHKVSTCAQCAFAIRCDIEAAFHGSEFSSPDIYMSTFQVPGVVGWVVDNLRFLDGEVLNATSQMARDNARKCLGAGLRYLVHVVVRVLDPQGVWPQPYDGFGNLDQVLAEMNASAAQPANSSELDMVADTCGEIVKIIHNKLIAPPDVSDKQLHEAVLVSYIYIAACAARRRERTIKNFPESVLPLLFRAAVNVKDKVYADRAWFCVTCIFKPPHQWNILNGSANPLFQVLWNSGSDLTRRKHVDIPVEPVLEKLCVMLQTELNGNNIDAASRSVGRILNVIHGIASVNLNAAVSIVRHPNLLGLLSQGAMVMVCITFQEVHAIFDETIEYLYKSLDSVWDRATLVGKVAPILFQSSHDESCHFLRACIYLWGSNSDAIRVVKVVPMQSQPFMLKVMVVLCEDLLKLRYDLQVPVLKKVAHQHPGASQAYVELAILLKVFSASLYRSAIDESFQTVMNVQAQLDKGEMMVKRDALKQDLAQIRNICLILGV